MRRDPKGFSRIMWDNWSPPGWYDEATFEAVATSWDNPDWADVTLHSYRARWDEAAPDPRSAALEGRVKATKQLSLPTVYIQGAVDGVNPSEASEDVPSKFGGPVRVQAPRRASAISRPGRHRRLSPRSWSLTSREEPRGPGGSRATRHRFETGPTRSLDRALARSALHGDPSRNDVDDVGHARGGNRGAAPGAGAVGAAPAISQPPPSAR